MEKKKNNKEITTTLTWYRADEVLPRKSGDDFLVIDKIGSIMCTSYSSVQKAFNASDHTPPLYQFNDIVYWADLGQIKRGFYKKLWRNKE